MKRLFLTLICTTALLTIPQQLLLISATQVTAQETTKKVLSSAQLQDLAKSITVKILTKNGSASGTLIAKNGNNYTILTNDHVINLGESYRIQAPDGKIYPATVIKEKPPSLKNQDAALFQFQSTVEYTIATLGISAPIAVEQKIVAAGFVSGSAKLVFTEGQISLLPDKSFQRGYRIGYNNKIQPGMSGGPILNYQGEVIGINAVHAYPISDKIYTYIDNSKPSAAERQQMRQYSWGLPIYAVAKIIPEFVAKSPRKIDNSGLRAKKGLIQNIDQIAQEITVLIPNANPEDMGSGVIIAQKGNIYYVLTADHVIWNRDEKKLKNKLEIVAPDNQRYAINVSNAKRMPGVDLAVVQFTSNQKYRVATLANYSLNTKGQKVFVSGFPGNKQQNKNKPHRILTAGILSQQQVIKLNTYLSFNNQSSLIPVQIQTVLSDGYDLLYSNITKGGMSGGAVLDTQGRLIGIHGRVEGEISLDFDGEINLGSSSGIPIRTFLNLVEQVGIDSDLKVETTAPATLKKSEEDVISEYLLPLDQVPKNSDDEISWLNYANQLWRSQKYAEAIKAVDKAISKKPDFYQAWYFKGVIFFSEKKDTEAITAFDKALKINPDFAQAWKLRGRVLGLLDKYSEALTSFNQAIALSPNQFDLYYWRGLSLAQLKRFPESIEAYNQAIKFYPDFQHSYLSRGWSYVNLQKYQQAIDDFTQVIQLDPKNADYYHSRGLAYSLLNKRQQAIDDLTQAIQLDPKNAQYYSHRGYAYYPLKKYQQAITDFTKAIQLDPKNAQYYNARGLVYGSLEDYKKAIEDITEAIRLDPKDFSYYASRGIAYSGLKDYKQAISDLTEAIRLDPKNAPYTVQGLRYSEFKDNEIMISSYNKSISIVYAARGDSHRNLKNYKQAIDDYTQAIKIDPKNPTYYRDRGVAYGKLKNYKQAIDDYTQAIKIDDKNAIYYVGRGLAYFQLKDYKQAINDYTQAIKIDDKNAIYYNARGLTYLELKDYKQAINDYTQAIQLDPKNAIYYNLRGFAYFQLKDYKQAINDYTQAIQLDPKNAGYYGDKGLTYFQLKDYKQAIDDYTQAIKLKPDFTEAYYVRGIAHYFLKDYKQAIDDWNQAIKLKPDYPEAYTNLGIVSYEMGEVETAINYWRNSIKINSNFAEAHLALGVAFYGKGDQEAGLKSAETALKLDKRYGKIEFLKENGWGEKLIKNSQEFLNNPRIKVLI
ncbi:serine protease [Dolichospermum circinale]|uniref:serine protease n=1 Tax=Dolichospermum circinale TaxID=109265 RepID=UPI00232FB001|nr:serine protease [Dolichospermum circinale]MDB9453684.1 tetratricopeptide repeat protein [Dolichospermum circinale CS-541/06]MDB9462305.1 tetratricopeptide repeat protein [Dolichospermum circinale CS-541/04]MDB9549065.1 tetratricopeptide repeat protein [Dolichospermum circinale CS-1031]